MRFDLGLVGLAGCLVDWILSRPWRYVALYFLPLLIAFCTVGLVAAGSWLNRDRLTEHYLELANKETSDWEKQWEGDAQPPQAQEKASAGSEPAKPKKIPASAELLYRRVQQLQQNDARSVFFVALCYIQRGATSQGFAMLERLAPVDRVGYMQAHAFLAEQMMMRPINVKEIPIVKHHAKSALDAPRLSPQLLTGFSDLFGKLNERDLAVKALKLAAERDTKYYLLLAQLATQYAGPEGQDKAFAKLAEDSLAKAFAHFKNKLDSDQRDVAARLMLADAYRLKSDLAGAEQTILEGLKIEDSPVFTAALSEVYCQQFIKTAQFSDKSWTGDIELLEKAFRLNPNNLNVFEQVAKLARITGKAPNDELMKQLMLNLTEGRATSVTHMWIAEYYLNSNQFAKAVTHLEQAVKRDPNSARCWNNLAYCLADLYPDRLEEALKGADQAVALMPMLPDFHDTRGTILMKLKRPGDAVAAYERAIEAVTRSNGIFRPQPAFHQRLAEAYAASGDEAMANTHKEYAEKLSEAIEKAQKEAQANAEAKRQPSQPATKKAAAKDPPKSAEPKPSEPKPSEPKKPNSEEAKAKEPKPEEPKPSEPKPSEPKPSEPKPSEPKPSEPKPSEPKPSEPKPSEPKPSEPKPEEPKPEEPKPEEPKPEEPKPEEPKPEEPKPEEPKPEEPKPEEPKPEEPKPEEPKPEEPKPEEPKPEEPKPEEPKPEEPKPEEPKLKRAESITRVLERLAWVS